MTPARLEEVEREMDGPDPMYVIACKLLAEVKRLRFEMEVVRDALDLHARAHQPAPVPVEVLRIIRTSVCKALGEEPTP